jgi:hypothetical protein
VGKRRIAVANRSQRRATTERKSEKGPRLKPGFCLKEFLDEVTRRRTGIR